MSLFFEFRFEPGVEPLDKIFGHMNIETHKGEAWSVRLKQAVLPPQRCGLVVATFLSPMAPVKHVELEGGMVYRGPHLIGYLKPV